MPGKRFLSCGVFVVQEVPLSSETGLGSIVPSPAALQSCQVTHFTLMNNIEVLWAAPE